ncbi:MAG TPA: hypothetical protein DCF94_01385 [Gammaproteobacteria bacterium]|nr:hypothetical protein [Gammaproteobacteria bacterium]|tara:strand:+ start:2162 stop:3046 length:885 start_codon:yes stop_codon:yes gene_type:complete
MKEKLLTTFFNLAVFLAMPVALAQLPELDLPSTVSGGTTTARFFGGASADNGATYSSSFGYDQAIDIDMEIQVESSHVNTVGNVYVLIVWGDQYFMRIESEAYEVWDLSLENLQAAFPAKTLQTNEAINIVNDVAFGPAGVSDTTLALYLAYDSIAAAGEIFYSGSALLVTIGAEQQSSSSFQLYTTNISSIIQNNCIMCHKTGGAAASSALRYVDSSSTNFQTTNYNTLVSYINNLLGGAVERPGAAMGPATNGSSLLLSKPQGTNHGGGIQLMTGSQDLQKLQDFVNTVLSE